MKRIIAILAIAFTFLATESKAQAIASWPNGSMTVVSATATTKVPAYTIVPTNLCYELNLTVDTSAVFTITNTYKVKAGAILYVKVTNGATAATRTITGSTGCTMASYTMTSAKIHLLTFVYDGTNFLNTGVIKIN
jgi:hypothetical protein